jgi:hypothetical protein
MEAFSAGTLAGAGSFRCQECGYAVALHGMDELPTCPHCHTGRFRRASLFPEHDGVGLQDALDHSGDYLAYEDGGTIRVVRLEEEWTRLGRSLAADMRFDDPTVSRRHALIHRDDVGARILDDRSLNGVFLNGERVDWHELEDGDEIAVGRFRLYFISLAGDRAPSGVESLTG